MTKGKSIILILLILGCLSFTSLCQDAQQHDDHDHEGEGEEHEEDHHDDHDDEADHEVEYLTTPQIWGFGFLAGFGVSLIGFLSAIFLLIAKKCCSDHLFVGVIKFFFSLACGALLGDAIVHILAESYASNELQSLAISGIFIGSLLGFIILQKVFQSCGVAHTHWHGEEQQSKNQIKSQNAKSNQIMVESMQNIKQTDEAPGEKVQEGNENCLKRYCKQYSKKGASGYMNLLGSLIHNFIDGLAVGVAFATGNPEEIAPVLIAVFAHQIPRQLGDVAVLLKSGFTEVQAVVCNGTINLISLVGVIIGLAIVNLDQAVKSYFLVFVAANFVFIAADIWKNMFKNKGEYSKLKNTIEFLGFSAGAGIMFALTLLQVEGEHNH